MYPFWIKYRKAMVEIFVFVNLSFLAVDIYFAHSVNDFAHPAEWIPLIFSLLAPLVLIAEFLLGYGRGSKAPRVPGLVLGGLAILVGISGLIFHLDSRFFAARTLHALIYTAPFAAPLAYAGLGWLLILNRMVDDNRSMWGRWLVFFALGGFVGNLALSLCDHAQNGFFHITEWIPVVASALAVGFLLTALRSAPNLFHIKVCMGVMLLQVLVGVVGFYLHAVSGVAGPSAELFENLVHGAPIFAPLLFANLALLGGLGLWDLRFRALESCRV
ncbi:hypothetical protein JYT83_00535 [bacterium AH-315-F18]|nr:hypothetical protein [bacterium AH-315-F18]